jgi:hypothetical protein
MRSGDFIFLLDGLDEVRHDLRGGIGNRLAHLQESYPGIILVVSSRPDESLHSWTLARQYLMQPFAKKEALALINKLPYKLDTKRKFREDVNTNLYDKYTSFLSNPLLLTIMLITYGDLGEVPSKMHIFYEQAYLTLFYRHDTWKEAGFQRTHYCALPVDDFQKCLSSFCISSYLKNIYDFTTTEALQLIKMAAEFDQLDIDPAAFLHDLVESICVLQVEGLKYTYIHRSFQEYFAAVFITRGPPVSLSSLLEKLTIRQSDNVIPMAFDINRNLLEREWIIPRLQSIIDSVADSQSNQLNYRPSTFLKRLRLCIDDADGHAITSTSQRVTADSDRNFMRIAKQLYPDFFAQPEREGCGLYGKKSLTTKQLCRDLAAEWFLSYREHELKLHDEKWRQRSAELKFHEVTIEWKSPLDGLWPEANRLLYKTYLLLRDTTGAVWFNRRGNEGALLAKFIERYAIELEASDETRSIPTGLEEVLQLAIEVRTLHEYLASCYDFSKKIGARLLDW